MNLTTMVNQILTPSFWSLQETSRARNNSQLNAMEAFQRRFDMHMTQHAGKIVSITQISKEMGAGDKSVKRELISMVQQGMAETVQVHKLTFYKIKGE